MHPEQQQLEPAIEELWLAACADAGLDPDECLLYVFRGFESQTGYGGIHFRKHRRLYESADLGDDINALIPELNTPERIDATRILVWLDRTPAGLAGMIRHELEHAVQAAAHDNDVEELYHLARRVLALRVGELAGGGRLYQSIPNELDANAVAAKFVRARYGNDRIDALLKADDRDGGLFRSLVGSAPVETLPERLLAFFLVHRDLCERYALEAGFEFATLINLSWPGAGQVWRDVVGDGGFALPR
jgi:hypothetical protein